LIPSWAVCSTSPHPTLFLRLALLPSSRLAYPSVQEVEASVCSESTSVLPKKGHMFSLLGMQRCNDHNGRCNQDPSEGGIESIGINHPCLGEVVERVQYSPSISDPIHHEILLEAIFVFVSVSVVV
jgi:hypothetical protein